MRYHFHLHADDGARIADDGQVRDLDTHSYVDAWKERAEAEHTEWISTIKWDRTRLTLESESIQSINLFAESYC